MRDKRTQAPARGVAGERVFGLVAEGSLRQRQAKVEDDASQLRQRSSWPGGMFLGLLAALSLVVSGCAGLVTGQTANPPTTVLGISNVQTSSTTTSGSLIIWTTNVPADSSVDYGTTPSYGSSTPVDSTMVTSHQVTLSGLAAGTTYYYQVSSTDSKNNHGKSSGHTFNTSGFIISGTITPTKGGSGATVALSGARSTTTATDSTGSYTFMGLASGSYVITPSNTGYSFTPASQNVSLSTTNVTGLNFTAATSAAGPAITTQPVSQTVVAGQTATFTVTAIGTAPLSYQWQKNGGNIAGATSSSYTTPATTTSDSGSTFQVVVTNTAGTATSNAATLTVNAAPVAPAITTQPVSQTVVAGQTATFVVTATGTAPLSYQWQKNGGNIAGATSSSYTTPATTTADSGSAFGVVVTNSVGTATSNAATLTVNAAPVAPAITTQPVSQTVVAGQTATFTVTATGAASLSYQWQKNGVNIAGATSPSYTTPATTTSDSGSAFRVVVTNTAGTATSNAATLTVNAASAPAINVNPTSINFGNVVVGTTLTQTLIISNTGTATLSITQITATGATFSGSGFTLPLGVNAGQQITITVAFQPTAVGAVSGSLSIASNAATTPTSVGLSGSGTAASLTLSISPASLSFGNVLTGATSPAQNVTITNAGNSNVTISQISVTGAGYSMTGGSTPVTLTPSQNLVLSVQFSPAVTGSVTGTVSIVSNATGSPATITLSGTGVVQHTAALTWTASTSTVAGYNVYRSTVSGGSYTKINSSLITASSYTDTTVQSGTTYYYVTTAVDSSGTESVYSSEVTAVIP